MSTPTEHAELPPLDADYAISDSQVEGFWRDGFITLRAVLSPPEIRAYAPVIRESAMRRFAARDMQAAAHGAFLQTLGLRFDSEGVRRFCLASRFGAIAARLLRVPAVRIFHEQALFKHPGGSDSHWHQDQYYWPLATDRSLGLWMPLVDCTRDMGTIRFVRGSHRYGDLAGRDISDESARHFEEFIAREGLEVHQVEALAAGDCTFHLGWTVHGAPANRSAAMREAMIVTFYPDGTRVDALTKRVARQRRARVPGRPEGGRTGRQRVEHRGIRRVAARLARRQNLQVTSGPVSIANAVASKQRRSRSKRNSAWSASCHRLRCSCGSSCRSNSSPVGWP
jgi:hypothetical protein